MAKPRVYVSFDEETYQVLSELTEELNASQSSLINQIITDSVPHMRELIKTIRAAKSKVVSKEPVKSFVEIVHDAYSDAMQETFDLHREVQKKVEQETKVKLTSKKRSKKAEK